MRISASVVLGRTWQAHVIAAAILVFAPGCASGPEPQTPAVPLATAAPEEPLDQPIDDTATLDVYGNPPTPILLDGKPIGTTPITGYKVQPGTHDVTFADELTGNRTMTVTISPGEGRSVTSDRPPSSMPNNAPPDKK